MRDKPDIVGRDVARRAVRTEFADAGTENDQKGEGRTARDGMNDARGIGVMIAPKLHHPALRMPAPSRIEDPQDRAEQHGDDPECAGTRALDDRARDDRGGRDREQEEGAPEHAVEAVPDQGIGRRDALLARVDAGEMRGHERIPGFGIWCRNQSAGNSRSVRKRKVDPPAKEEEGDGHDRDRDRILHQRFEMVASTRHADFIGTEADMDEKHHDDRHEVVELREDGRQCI